MTIGDAAKTQREAARRDNGEFGEQQRSEPAVNLSTRIPTLVADGPTRDVVKFNVGDVWEPTTISQARSRLGIPDDEPEETVRETIQMLSASDIAFIDQEASYPNPGYDANIATDEWATPGAYRWVEEVPAWSMDGQGEQMYVHPVAVLDLTHYGFSAEQLGTVERFIEDHISAHSLQKSYDIESAVEDDGVHVSAILDFDQESFTPTLVSGAAFNMLDEIELEGALWRIARSGTLVADDDYGEGSKINGRAALYAVRQGHVPTSAEMVAIAMEFLPHSSLARGYVRADFGTGNEEMDSIVERWMTARKGNGRS